MRHFMVAFPLRVSIDAEDEKSALQEIFDTLLKIREKGERPYGGKLGVYEIEAEEPEDPYMDLKLTEELRKIRIEEEKEEKKQAEDLKELYCLVEDAAGQLDDVYHEVHLWWKKGKTLEEKRKNLLAIVDGLGEKIERIRRAQEIVRSQIGEE